MRSNKLLHQIGLITRTILGVVFIFSGFVKALDPLGTVYKIEDYLKAFGGFFTELMPLATIAAVGLITVEFVLGVAMFMNIKTSWTAWICLAFYLVMTPLTLYVAIANPVSDCGCFGDALVLSNWQTFAKNVVLLLLTLLLLGCRNHIHPRWIRDVEISVVVLAVMMIGGLMLYTHLHLPIMDFRPYKVGNNIPQLMELPEGAKQDVYEHTYILERDGEQAEFSLEEYSQAVSEGWEFVDRRDVLVEKGDEAPIHDFTITTMEGDDITEEVLYSDEVVTLVIMYDLERTNVDMLGRVSTLYQRAIDGGTPFYILTGSDEGTIRDFCSDAGMNDDSSLSPWESLEDVFCTCDPVTLKTIVRANPGVIQLQNGTILRKYNIRKLKH